MGLFIAGGRGGRRKMSSSKQFLCVFSSFIHYEKMNTSPALVDGGAVTVVLTCRGHVHVYRQSGGLPENNRGEQLVHEHSDRHGIPGNTSHLIYQLSSPLI